MKPEYVVTKSAWGAVTFLCVLFFWLIIPLIVMLVRILIIKHVRIEFYDNYIISKSGVLSKKERRTVFPGIISVSVDQSLWGRICHYGTVRVDVVGKWDIDLSYTAQPEKLKAYLETKLIDPKRIRTIMH